jgi:hypothetical protein
MKGAQDAKGTTYFLPLLACAPCAPCALYFVLLSLSVNTTPKND